MCDTRGAQRRPFGRTALVWGFGIGLMVASLGAFRLIGPVHAIRGSQRLETFTPVLYLVPIFLPVGMLVGELWRSVIDGAARHARILACGLVAMALLGAVRFALLIPVSGHAVILGFVLVWPWRSTAVGGRLVGLLLLAQAAYYKLLVWCDPVTRGVGLLVGAMLAWLGRLGLGTQVQSNGRSRGAGS